jgi:hypothetical protein
MIVKGERKPCECDELVRGKATYCGKPEEDDDD